MAVSQYYCPSHWNSDWMRGSRVDSRTLGTCRQELASRSWSYRKFVCVDIWIQTGRIGPSHLKRKQTASICTHQLLYIWNIRYEIRQMELTLIRFLFESLQNVRWKHVRWQYVLKVEKKIPCSNSTKFVDFHWNYLLHLSTVEFFRHRYGVTGSVELNRLLHAKTNLRLTAFGAH